MSIRIGPVFGLSAALPCQIATPPSVPIATNVVGYLDSAQAGTTSIGAQRIVAYSDPAYTGPAYPILSDATTTGVCAGGTIAWASACGSCAPSSYVPWFAAVGASAYSWPYYGNPIPFGVAGRDRLWLDPAYAWTGFPIGILTTPASNALPAWGAGDLWVTAWQIPTSPSIPGFRVCSQFVRVDAAGITLSDLWCVRVL